MATTQDKKITINNKQIFASWGKCFPEFGKKEIKTFIKNNSYIIDAKPIIKRVGGKRQLIKQFEKIYPQPEKFNNYFEPFLGGGAVFFSIQRKKSFLTDINEELINTYQVVKNNPYDLINFLKTLPYNKEFFLKIRAWDREENRQKKYSNIERAGRFIYLNRTCFNGLYRENSKGQFNVPFGKYTNPDIVQEKNILNASKLLNKTEAEIKCQSFEKVLDKAEIDDFVYFDPPYDVLTESANFTSYNKGGFGQDMQKKLAEVCKKLNKKGVNFMLSNHNTPFIRKLYKGFNFKIVKARRNVNSKASGRGEVEEIVVFNYKIKKYDYKNTSNKKS